MTRNVIVVGLVLLLAVALFMQAQPPAKPGSEIGRYQIVNGGELPEFGHTIFLLDTSTGRIWGTGLTGVGNGFLGLHWLPMVREDSSTGNFEVPLKAK
jgi:hypothetical protein